jgi:hypothetical protein
VGAFTEDEIKEIFSPLALTGYLLGRYDHMSALKYTLSGYTGGVTQPDDDEDAA